MQKASFLFNSLKTGISNHSLFLKNLACIYLCVCLHTHYFLYTHINVCLYHMVFISKQPPNGTLSPLSPLSLSHTIPLSLAVSPCIWTPSCLACTAPRDLMVWSLVLVCRLTSYSFKASVITCVRSVTFFNLLLTPGRKGFCVLCLSNFGLVKTVYLNWKTWDVVMANVKCSCIWVMMVLTGGYVSLSLCLFFFF